MARPDITKYATAETRRKGALAANKARSERAKTPRQRLDELIQADVEDGYASMKAAWRQGDWRAFQAALAEAYGKPTERAEVTGADGGPVVVEDRSASLAEVAAILRAAGQLDE